MGYREFARFLDPDQPFYGLQPLGLNSRTTPLNRMEDITRHYLLEMTRHQPSGPYYLGGFSFGGLVTLELARQLTDAGYEVPYVFLLDTVAPSQSQNHPDGNDHKGRQRGWQWIRNKLLMIRELPKSDRLAFIWLTLKLSIQFKRRWFRLLGKIRPEWNPEERYRRVYHANHQAAQAYSLKSYQGKVVLFKVSYGHKDMEELINHGWPADILPNLTMIPVPGNHNTILRSPTTRIVADHITRLILPS